MNLKERGITVGDLLILIIIIITSTILIKSFSKEGKLNHLARIRKQHLIIVIKKKFLIRKITIKNLFE